MTYSVDYFIEKFEAIPEDKWCVGSLHSNGRSCALGHCGMTADPEVEPFGIMFFNWSDEGMALTKLLDKLGLKPWEINDYMPFMKDAYRYIQKTPKQRILAALNDVKKMQDGQPAETPKPIEKPTEKIRYVSVPETIKEETKELVLN